jgi:phage terminase large subunit-like protein
VIRDHLRTARFFAGVWSSPVALNNPIHRHESIMVNGRPGLVISSQDENGYWKFHTIISIEVENGKIARIFTQRNPEKLGALDIGAAPNSKN